MIDNVTGKATRLDVRPLTVEGILRTNRRDRPLLLGFLLNAMLEAARRLWPDFEPERRKELRGHPMVPREKEEPDVEFIPTWRRQRGQGLVEYALILALIAVVAIVGLAFLGGVVANVLSQLASSI